MAVGVNLDNHCPVAVRAPEGDPSFFVGLEHRDMGHAEPVLVSARDHRQARCDGAQEGGRAGCPAAVVRNFQEVDVKRMDLANGIGRRCLSFRSITVGL